MKNPQLSTVAAARARSRRTAMGPAWHYSLPGLNVLKVAGTHYEMGRQHGALLRDQLPEGPLAYYRHYVEQIVSNGYLKYAAPLAWFAIKHLIGRRVAQALPDYAVDALKGLAEGSGARYSDILDGATMPDSLVWLVARLIQLKLVDPAVSHRLALGLGCTSALAWGAATADGKMLHARNLDYHGVSAWPKTAAVIFHEPDVGLRYVSVASAGVVLGGITAMNEAGLTLTVHQHMFTDGTRLGGTPVGAVGDLIMRQARTLDQAEGILRQHTPIGCWTYLIGSAAQEQVLCYEENPDHRKPLRTTADEQTFAYSNIYLDEELAATERNLYGSYWRHNLGRYQRAQQHVSAGYGRLTPGKMASLLADTGDIGCRISEAISMLMTVSSVVFRPDDGVLWVASGSAPTSHTPFFPFSLSAEDFDPEHGTLVEQCPSDRESEAFTCYRDAYLAYFDRRDVGGARLLMERAAQLEPEQPLYHFLSGLLALRQDRSNDAFDAFGRALTLSHPHEERRAAFHLWRGRAADVNGNREAALKDYRAVFGTRSDPPVSKAARAGIRRAYQRRQTSSIVVDFSMADVIEP